MKYDGKGQRTIDSVTSKKISPGLSTFAQNPELAAEYMKPLFKHAAEYIAPELQSETLAYIQATAGMRLVPEVRRGGGVIICGIYMCIIILILLIILYTGSMN